MTAGSLADIEARYRQVWDEMATAQADRYRELRPQLHALGGRLDEARRIAAEEETAKGRTGPRQYQLFEDA